MRTELSPDGKTVTTADHAGVMHICNAENGMLLNTHIPDSKYPGLDHFHFLDSITLLFSTPAGVHCLDVRTLEEKWRYDCWASGLAVSGDHRKVALVCDRLIVLDAFTGEFILDIPLESISPDVKTGSVPSRIVFDNSGHHVCFDMEGKAYWYDLDRLALIRVCEASFEHITDIAVGSDGRTAVVSFRYDLDRLRAMDPDSGCLFTSTMDDLFAIPLFDIQMLLDEAHRQLRGRTLTPEEKKELFIVE